jgi:hypothetical protein
LPAGALAKAAEPRRRDMLLHVLGRAEARPSVSFDPLLKGQPRITRMISPVFRVKSLKRESLERA